MLDSHENRRKSGVEAVTVRRESDTASRRVSAVATRRGRPSELTAMLVERIEAAFRAPHATQVTVAAAVGVSRRGLLRWIEMGEERGASDLHRRVARVGRPSRRRLSDIRRRAKRGRS